MKRLLALFQRPQVVVYVPSRRNKARKDYEAKQRALHAKLMEEVIENDDARIEMQRTLFGFPAVRDGLGV